MRLKLTLRLLGLLASIVFAQSSFAGPPTPLSCTLFSNTTTQWPSGAVIVNTSNIQAGTVLGTGTYVVNRKGCYLKSTYALDYAAAYVLPLSTGNGMATDNPNIGVRLKSYSLEPTAPCTNRATLVKGFTVIEVAFSKTTSSSSNTCNFGLSLTLEFVALSSNLEAGTTTYSLKSGPMLAGAPYNTFPSLSELSGAWSSYNTTTIDPAASPYKPLAYWFPNATAIDGGVLGNGGGSVANMRFVIPTCTLALSSQAIKLPDIYTGNLTTAGQTAGETRFNISLVPNSCNLQTYNDTTWPLYSWSVKADWTFSPAANTTDTIANTATYPAPNVVLRMYDTTGAAVATGSKTLLSTVTRLSAGNGTTILPTYTITTPNPQYSVRYYALGQAGPGAVKGVATFNLTYE